MQTFTFFMLEGPGQVPGFIFDAFEDSKSALTFGRSLLTPRNGYKAVEVILDDRPIARLEPAASFAHPGLQH
jgi:hypothetical protein